MPARTEHSIQWLSFFLHTVHCLETLRFSYFTPALNIIVHFFKSTEIHTPFPTLPTFPKKPYFSESTRGHIAAA
jgi:hypothetical protein